MPIDRILRLPELAALLGLSEPSVYLLIKHSQFPPGIAIGLRTRGWRSSDVQAWIKSRPTRPIGPRPGAAKKAAAAASVVAEATAA